MDISERFKIVRNSLGYSQRDIAKTLNCSFSAVQAYEIGKSVPGGNVLEALVRLGFNANWLLTGEGEMRRGEKIVTPVDAELLEAVIGAVEEYLDQVKGNLKPAKKAQLVAALYDMFLSEEKRTIDKSRVIQLVRLAA